jgi:hypothetical protein
MLNTKNQDDVINIWEKYNSSQKIVKDTKGQDIPDIDNQRINCQKTLIGIIEDYLKKISTVGQFKTAIDSFNKRNNYWGFTATKGQMFFNQLVKSGLEEEKKLNDVLMKTIIQPQNIEEASSKIDLLDKYCQKFFNTAKDKRTVPNPGSICYFLSYFWQVYDYEKWPIMYTSLIEAFAEINLWERKETQSKTYKYFYELNNEIKSLISSTTGRKVSYWDIEHAFWNFKGNPNKKQKPQLTKSEPSESMETIAPSFVMSDYLIPKISKLVDIGNDREQSSAKKGYLFEQLVAEAFKQLDFEVEIYGQGTGRNPDVIVKHREDNTAFLVDAKAYSEGYSLGLDNRAIKEYINIHCPKLLKEGYKKIGFIIVCNSFNSDLDEFINEITWNTEVKRFILLSTEALLYLVAYKTRDKQNLNTIIESIVSIKNPITADKIISEFEDV